RLVRLGVHQHFRQVLRDRKNGRRLQRRGHGLPNVHVSCHDSPVNRGSNHGVVEICLRHVYCCLFLADLGLGLRNVCRGSAYRGIRRIVVCFCKIQLLLAQDAILEQSSRAVVVGFGLNQRRFRFFHVRTRRHPVCFRVFHIRRFLQPPSLEPC